MAMTYLANMLSMLITQLFKLNAMSYLKKLKNMQDQSLDDGCRIAELEEALRDKQALIPDEHDTTAQQFESLAKSE